MSLYLLDTNIVSHFVKEPRGRIGRRIMHEDDEMVATSIIVAAKLHFGVERKRSSRLTKQVDDALYQIVVLPLELGVDDQYGRLRADLERRGQLIGALDMLIAAHALALGATLVTDNVREFERVEVLTIQNWLRND